MLEYPLGPWNPPDIETLEITMVSMATPTSEMRRASGLLGAAFRRGGYGFSREIRDESSIVNHDILVFISIHFNRNVCFFWYQIRYKSEIIIDS